MTDQYDLWLADYLLTIDTTPNEEQKGLCVWVDRMEPEAAMLMLGMNAALYQLDVEMIEEKIVHPDTYVGELSDYGTPEQIERLKRELADKQRYCPDSTLVDLGYRKPLGSKPNESRDQLFGMLLPVIPVAHNHQVFSCTTDCRVEHAQGLGAPRVGEPRPIPRAIHHAQ